MIEEVAGAVKDLIKREGEAVRHVRGGRWDHSASAPCSTRTEKAGDHWQPKERRGPSDQQADGDVDTAAPDAGSSTGVSGRVRLARSGADRVLVRAPAVVVGATQCGVCCLSFVNVSLPDELVERAICRSSRCFHRAAAVSSWPPPPVGRGSWGLMPLAARHTAISRIRAAG